MAIVRTHSCTGGRLQSCHAQLVHLHSPFRQIGKYTALQLPHIADFFLIIVIHLFYFMSNSLIPFLKMLLK